MTFTLEAPPVLDAALAPIREKVLAGERLSREDGITLYRTRDIFTVGELANIVRERLHGRQAYYNINRHINYTNYCVLRCKFCSFYRAYPKERIEGSRDQGIKTAGEQIDGGVDRSHNAEHRTQKAAKDGAAGDSAIQNLKSNIQDRADREMARPIQNPKSKIQNPSNPQWPSSDGYEMTVDQVADVAEEAARAGATEVHIVGGLHPKLPFSYYTDMCRAIKRRCPALHIKAFTAIEIVHFTRISRPRLSVEEVLVALREAGLDSMPGGGAEIFDDRVHDEAFKAKVGEKHWFDVHRAAHDLGIPTNATMLYGHIESVEDRITHLIKLREHQDESLARMKSDVGSQKSEVAVQKSEIKSQESEVGDRAPGVKSEPACVGAMRTSDFLLHTSDFGDSRGLGSRAAFQCCIPLSFIPDGSEFAHLPGPTGLDDLRTLAICRLMLDNVAHIKAFWIMQTPKLSQVALNWGVDDFDGTVVWYDITKREGRGTQHQELTVEQISSLIREAGCEPVERDTLYRPVTR